MIIITGAAGRLGAAIACQLAGEPLTDLIISDIDVEGLEVTRASVRSFDAVIEAVPADIGNLSEIERLAAQAMERFGRVDVFIQNAGILNRSGRIHNLRPEDWSSAFRVNVMGAVNSICAAVPLMRTQHSGSIILTASVAGMTAWSHAGPYCATKAAVIQLARVAAIEYAQDGIRINCVCPGAFESAIHADLPAEALERIRTKHPLGLGSAEDLVGAYSYLASEASRWTTGSALVVDGGYSAP